MCVSMKHKNLMEGFHWADLCAPDEYRCDDNQCIAKKKMCDGIFDCDGAEDERFCPDKGLNCPLITILFSKCTYLLAKSICFFF